MARKAARSPRKKEEIFNHPIAGRCERDPNKVAILWASDSKEKARNALLKAHNLVLVEPPKAGKRGPHIDRVNQTASLFWAETKNKKPILQSVLTALEASNVVLWIAGVYKAPRSPKESYEGFFCVNPTRLYLSADAASRLGNLEDLDIGAQVDAQKTARLHGLVALRIENVSLPGGRGAIQVARDRLAPLLADRGDVVGARDISFESIPLISPTCSTAECCTPSTDVCCTPATSAFVPNDPLFSQEWGMWRISAPRAWPITRGDPDVVVAVIDQGVELAHPDLDVHPLSWNASSDIPDGSPVGNHGTPCAGIVAATMDNATGVAGVAGQSRVMAIATSTWADIDIAEGLYFAADNGARVVSMSFGQYAWWGSWDFDIIRDALQYALDKGLVLVAASGNENGSTSRFPGSDVRTICVGGSNRDDVRKSIGDNSSESWWGACWGNDLDVVAPCLEIPSTDRLGAAGYGSGDYTLGFNGTSAATPHVAGLAALICSIRPDLPNETVREIIESTCDKISPDTYTYSLVGHKANGTWNDEVGYGRINAERAVLMACNYGRAGHDPTCTTPTIRLPKIPKECVSPPAPPWKPYDQCIFWYDFRFIMDPERIVQILVIYEHCLRLLGRQQGPLIFTTTLLPGETVRLYHYDRYRRVRSETQRMSVHTSLRQTVASLMESMSSQREKRYQEFLATVRGEDDRTLSVGGQLFPVSWDVEDPDPHTTSLLVTASLETVASQFQRIIRTASQQVDAERSLVISTYEDSEQRDITSRTLTNTNACRAVTYFVRRVYECYELTTRVKEIKWRDRFHRQTFGAWRTLEDLEEADPRYRKILDELLRKVPAIGRYITDPLPITVPTDGALYEAELAHCSSCEPAKQVEIKIALEKAKSEARKVCLEAELLSLEVQRRTSLLKGNELGPFEPCSDKQDSESTSPAEESTE